MGGLQGTEALHRLILRVGRHPVRTGAGLLDAATTAVATFLGRRS